MKEHILGVLIGLITFFLFPIIEYIGKKICSKNDGKPELWYLPDYCFRLVIRNIPRKVKLYELKYESIIIKKIPPTCGSSVTTFKEETLNKSETLFLLPRTDKIILSFKLELKDGKAYFQHTNKLGKIVKEFELEGIDRIESDYIARIDNKFHFNTFVGRRVLISKKELYRFLNEIIVNPLEQPFKLQNVVKIA